MTDSAAVKRLVREGEEELKEKEHPDPYVNPHMPGGEPQPFYTHSLIHSLPGLQ